MLPTVSKMQFFAVCLQAVARLVLQLNEAQSSTAAAQEQAKELATLFVAQGYTQS